jgi:hypothetical protein
MRLQPCASFLALAAAVFAPSVLGCSSSSTNATPDAATASDSGQDGASRMTVKDDAGMANDAGQGDAAPAGNQTPGCFALASGGGSAQVCRFALAGSSGCAVAGTASDGGLDSGDSDGSLEDGGVDASGLSDASTADAAPTEPLTMAGSCPAANLQGCCVLTGGDAGSQIVSATCYYSAAAAQTASTDCETMAYEGAMTDWQTTLP